MQNGSKSGLSGRRKCNILSFCPILVLHTNVPNSHDPMQLYTTRNCTKMHFDKILSVDNLELSNTQRYKCLLSSFSKHQIKLEIQNWSILGTILVTNLANNLNEYLANNLNENLANIYMIILKMCFSVNQIDDLQSSNKK